MWTQKFLYLKELDIIRKNMYFLRYDKTGLTPVCFSGPELATTGYIKNIYFITISIALYMLAEIQVYSEQILFVA